MNETKVTYKITVKGHVLVISGELIKSQLSQYGNHTAVLLDISKDGDIREECIDTRYAKDITKNFREWLQRFILNTWPVSINEMELIKCE